MTRLLTAAALVAALLAPAVASASTYSAKPLAPAAKRLVAGGINWNCGPDACLGSTDESRPLVLCQGLAKRAGRLESFAVNGRAFAAADLDKCNSAARGGTAAALAGAN
jgi:hypothetical protein